MRFNGLGKSKTFGEYADKLEEIMSADGLLSGLHDDDIAFLKAIAKCLQKVFSDGDSHLIKLWEGFVEGAVNKNLSKTEMNAVQKSFVTFLLNIVPKVYTGRKSTLDPKIVYIGTHIGLLHIVEKTNRICKQQLQNDDISRLIGHIDGHFDSIGIDDEPQTIKKKPKLDHENHLSSGSREFEEPPVEKLAETFEGERIEGERRYVPYQIFNFLKL